MGLDNDIYTILNNGWVIATIAKPIGVHLNNQGPRPQTRHLHIQAAYSGTLTQSQYDNLADMRLTSWKLTGYEGTEADAVKCIKVIKKLMHEASISAGHYHIDSFAITEKDQLVTYYLQGHLYKELEHDDF